MKTFPKVFVVVLNYNGKNTIKQCLDSVYKSDYPNIELVVVDNNSTDESFELARKYHGKSHFIKNEKNVGFAAGNNVGIRFALEKMADYIFLLNNDAQVEMNTISRLIEEMEKDEDLGIGAPIIKKYPDSSIWYAGGKIKWTRMRAVHNFQVESDHPYETEFASGCAMLIKKDIFKRVGLLDDKYFLYYEDADFSHQARREGFKIKVVPDAIVGHIEKSEENLSQKIYWLVISGIIFFKKNSPQILKPWIFIFLIVRKIKNKLDIIFKKDNLSKVVNKAYKDYARGK